MARNVLIITADQLRFDALAHNAPWAPPWALAHAIRTPHLDALARESAHFVNAFSPNPVCVPARMSITSGLYPHKAGDRKALHAESPRLAQVFGEHGYATYAVGKLHYNPYAPPGEPRNLHGFAHAELHEEGRIVKQFDPTGQTAGLEDYHDHLRQVGWGGYSRGHGLGNNDIHPVRSPLPAEHHEEAWVASRAIANLEQHRRERPNQPFLLWASFAKPHSPYEPPEPYDRLYDPRHLPPPAGTWDDDTQLDGRDQELVSRRYIYGWDRYSPEAIQLVRAHYAGLVSFHDAQVGRLLGWLRAAGLMDDTVIVYTSDHGDLLGDFGRFFKKAMFDGSVRVPMLWRVPGAGRAPGIREQLVGLQDLLPTLCAQAGVPLAKPVDGVDLSPALADASVAGRKAFVAYTTAAGNKAMLRTTQWKYIYCTAGGTEELYDAGRLDGELINLAHAAEHAATRAALRAELLDWCQGHDYQALLRDGDLAMDSLDSLPAHHFDVDRLGWRRY